MQRESSQYGGQSCSIGTEADLLGDRVVDDHRLATDFWTIVRLGELGGHVQTEVAVPLHLLVSQLDNFAS